MRWMGARAGESAGVTAPGRLCTRSPYRPFSRHDTPNGIKSYIIPRKRHSLARVGRVGMMGGPAVTLLG